MDYKLIFIASTVAVIFILEGFFPHFTGRTGRVQHGLPHVFTAVVNAFLTRLFFAGLTLYAVQSAKAGSIGLLNTVAFTAPARYVLGFILFDVWMYFWHMANHRISLLWLFHRAHHSDTDMDTTTALRFHPGELFFSSVARAPVIMLIGMDFGMMVLFETVLNVSTLFHHSNLRIPEKWDRVIRLLFVSPNMHRVHHSVVLQETNSNFTSLFSLWDRLFRTFRTRDDTRAITLGLPVFREKKWQGAWGFFVTPLVRSQAR